MKILNPVRFYKGSKGDKTIPALIPPDNQSLLKSISISESVDLLCEGPIYGLVDQFGKKVYGLDMLKGIYLNKVPVMNYDGKYNFRNVVMEINLGTENQTPLQNFKNVYIWRPANFKLLGPITTNQDVRNLYENGIDQITGAGSGKIIGTRNFTAWATGWPTDAKDPFVYVHHIRNKDVKKIRVSLIIEALFDTVDQGKSDGSAGSMGMSKSTDLQIVVTCGSEGTNKTFTKVYQLNGTVQSPYACMLGEPLGQFNSSASYGAASSVAGGLTNNNSSVIASIGARTVGISSDILETLKPLNSQSF
jgi:hypothetical protein